MTLGADAHAKNLVKCMMQDTIDFIRRLDGIRRKGLPTERDCAYLSELAKNCSGYIALLGPAYDSGILNDEDAANYLAALMLWRRDIKQRLEDYDRVCDGLGSYV